MRGGAHFLRHCTWGEPRGQLVSQPLEVYLDCRRVLHALKQPGRKLGVVCYNDRIAEGAVVVPGEQAERKDLRQLEMELDPPNQQADGRQRARERDAKVA